jgi:uncharacterized membrane protein
MSSLTIVPAIGPAQRASRRVVSSSWIVGVLLFIGALPLTFGVLRLLQLAGVSDVMPPSAAPAPVAVHVVGAFLFAITGAFQFSARIRRVWPKWHRFAGRLAVAGALLVALSALWLSFSYATPDPAGVALAALRIAVSLGLIVSLVLSVAAVMRRDIGRHRAWMVRAYALGLGATTQMLVLMVAEVIIGTAPDSSLRAALMGFAWCINLAYAEWVIRRPMPHRN